MACAPNGFQWDTFAFDLPSSVNSQHDPATYHSLDLGIVSRKRPKYTRSKSGCLVCRQKKVKCDEVKPKCQRCSNAQRECVWPEPRHSQRYLSSSSSGDSVQGGSPTFDQSPVQSTHPDLDEFQCRPAPSAHARETIFGLLDASRAGSLATSASSISPLSIPSNSYTTCGDGVSPIGYGADRGRTHDLHVSPRPPHVHAATPFVSRLGIVSRNQRPLALTYSPDVLAPYYNDEQERHLMLHFTQYASKIILSIPDIDPISSAQVMLAMSQPPGADPLVDALRTAILGISATHQAFLLSYPGIGTGLAGTGSLRRISSNHITAQQQLAQTYRREAKKLLAGACTNTNGARSDTALIVVQAIALMDIFCGGSGEHWSRNLALGKALIKLRGGPSIVLQQSHSSSRVQTNVFLELLAAYDTFGCLATGGEPELLAQGIRSWWNQGLVSHFENVFGFSRGLLLFVADLAQLLSRVISPNRQILEVVEEEEKADSNILEGQALMERLERWSTSHGPVHERVRVGNEIYQRTIQISLLLEVFKHPVSHPLVQDHARTIITLTANATNAGLGVILIWPVLIAGSALAVPYRHLVVTILAKFRTQCCFEVDIAQNIIFKVWERTDRQEPGADWRSVVKDHNWTFLIL